MLVFVIEKVDLMKSGFYYVEKYQSSGQSGNLEDNLMNYTPIFEFEYSLYDFIIGILDKAFLVVLIVLLIVLIIICYRVFKLSILTKSLSNLNELEENKEKIINQLNGY